MTLMLIEDTLSEEEQLEQLASPTVKCSWCGALIRIVAEEPAPARCAVCYERMLAEYERSLKTNDSAARVSDR
jgi:hypothetical protein